MSFTSVLLAIPAIISIVRSIEEQFPMLPGAAKLTAVLDMIASVTGSVTDLAPSLSPLIAAIVRAFNKSGTFSHKTSTETSSTVGIASKTEVNDILFKL